MATPQFTPPPWNLVQGDFPDDVAIADIGSWAIVVTEEQADAGDEDDDARLMAGARDMYDLLRFWLDDVTRRKPRMLRAGYKFKTKVEAVLAEVEGRNHA